MTRDKHDDPSEQAVPSDIHPEPDAAEEKSETSIAHPFVAPAGADDDSDRPVVNPVTGGAL